MVVTKPENEENPDDVLIADKLTEGMNLIVLKRESVRDKLRLNPNPVTNV